MGSWNDGEKLKSSTWRELEAVYRVLQSISMSLKANVCESNSIKIVPEWVSRQENVKADKISKTIVCDDWEIDDITFEYFNKNWDPHTVGIGLKSRVLEQIQDGGIFSADFDELGRKVSSYLLQSRSDNTNNKYVYAYKRWERFILKQWGLSLPAKPIHLALYLTKMIDTGSSYRVVQSAFYEIDIDKNKTDQYRLGEKLVISNGESAACPYNLLSKYFSSYNLLSKYFSFYKLLSKQSSSEQYCKPIFRSGKRCSLIYKNKKLSYTRARECIVARLKEVCCDINIGLDYLRAGGATVAANAAGNGTVDGNLILPKM
ncbi:Hypothetical predicted protein, partial [Mytilus galloprovincialis]